MATTPSTALPKQKSPRLRVLYICHEAALYGSQQSLKLLVEGLQARYGDQLELAVSIARPGPLQEALSGSGVTVFHHKRLVWFKHSRRSGTQRLVDALTLLLNLPLRVCSLWRAVAWANIIHTNSLVSLEGAVTARLQRKPHIWHVREWLTPHNPGLFPVLPIGLTRWLVSALACRVIAISSAVAAGVGLDATHPKLRLIPNAVPDSAGPPVVPVAPRNIFRIGFVGRFSKGKRVPDLIEAFTRLMGEVPDTQAELWLLGRAENPADTETIRTAILNSPVSDRIVDKGFQTDMAAVYTQLTVLVLPAENEAFGRVLIEAMAHGVPCIAARAGGMPDIIADERSGWLYPVKDVKALADCLLAAYACWWRQPDEWQAMRQHAVQQVNSRFSLAAQLQAIMQTYKSI